MSKILETPQEHSSCQNKYLKKKWRLAVLRLKFAANGLAKGDDVTACGTQYWEAVGVVTNRWHTFRIYKFIYTTLVLAVNLVGTLIMDFQFTASILK